MRRGFLGSAASTDSRSESTASRDGLHDERDAKPESIEEQRSSRVSINDLMLAEVLGCGSFSVVVRAQHLDEQFALKIMEKRVILKEDKVRQVNRERDLLARLSHPGVVSLHFSFQDEENLYLAMELATHGDLFWHIRNGGGGKGVSCSSAKWWLAQLVDTLAYLHENNVVHRDLKPENVFIGGPHGRLLIGDFGTARDTAGEYQMEASAEEGPNDDCEDSDDEFYRGDGSPMFVARMRERHARRRRRSFVGTAEYIAPEVLDGEVARPAADLWALGCVAFQLFNGRPPFHGDTEYLTFLQVQAGKYKWDEGCAEKATDSGVDFVNTLLNKVPPERGDAATDLRAHPFFASVDWKSLWDSEHPSGPVEAPFGRPLYRNWASNSYFKFPTS